MCLAVPGRLLDVYDDHGLRMGRVDYDGTRKVACLEYVPQARPGDYVVVHAGFAISLLDEAEARRALDLFDEMLRAAAAEGLGLGGAALDAPGGGPPDGGRAT